MVMVFVLHVDVFGSVELHLRRRVSKEWVTEKL